MLKRKMLHNRMYVFSQQTFHTLCCDNNERIVSDVKVEIDIVFFYYACLFLFLFFLLAKEQEERKETQERKL